MKFTRRILHLRRVLGILPRLASNLDALAGLIPRLLALDSAIRDISINLHSLEESLRRIERIEVPAIPVAHNGHAVAVRQDHEWSRLKILGKFVQLSGKAKDIEMEWQKIQQDEHNAKFAFNILHGNDEHNHAYKKGIVEGIKWCVDRFC